MLAQQQRLSYLLHAPLHSRYLKSLHIHLMDVHYKRHSLSNDDDDDMTIEHLLLLLPYSLFHLSLNCISSVTLLMFLLL